MKINIELLENLKALSLTSSHNKVWVSSALVHRNKIISYGLNSMKSNPFQKRYGKNEYAIYKHAEVDCIQTALKLKFCKFENSVLYVARMKYESTDRANYVSGLAMPCDGCLRCIENYGIRSVIYTMDHGQYEQFGVMML